MLNAALKLTLLPPGRFPPEDPVPNATSPDATLPWKLIPDTMLDSMNSCLTTPASLPAIVSVSTASLPAATRVAESWVAPIRQSPESLLVMQLKVPKPTALAGAPIDSGAKANVKDKAISLRDSGMKALPWQAGKVLRAVALFARRWRNKPN